ncbi:MAG: adenosine deaminase [Acidobacteriota bacterium]
MTTSSNYAELHLHLEGCLDVETLLEIQPSLDRNEVEAQLRFDDFAGFLASFKFAVMQLETPEHYRLLARRALSRLRSQGIIYVEMIHSAGICLWRKQDARAIVEALIEEGRRADVTVRWILDGVRQFGGERFLEVARLAVQYAGEDVVGLGIGGDEQGCLASELDAGFRLARAHGLKALPHAGETSSPASVWEALGFGAYRIGHGIRSVEDPLLLAELVRRDVPLEICISSNLGTGVCSRLEDHPLPALLAAGVKVVLSTDDPAFFATTLAHEYALAARLGLSAEDLAQIRRNGFHYAAGAAPTP